MTRPLTIAFLTLFVASLCGPGDAAAKDGKGKKKMSVVDAQTLACALIDARTESAPADFDLDMDGYSAEGAFADVHTLDGKVVRIKGGMLGESFRSAFDFKYVDGALACASETYSTLHTIMSENPEFAPPPQWRRDWRVFKGKKLVHKSADKAPRNASTMRNPKETLKLAAELLARADKAKAAKPAGR